MVLHLETVKLWEIFNYIQVVNILTDTTDTNVKLDNFILMWYCSVHERTYERFVDKAA